MCLTSNVGNGFKVPSYAQHPVSLLQESGVRSDEGTEDQIPLGGLQSQL